MFYLPAPGITADCVNNSPAAFLKDQSSRCSQHVALDGDCSSLRALRMDTYTNIQLFAVSSRFLPLMLLIMLTSCRENAQSSSLTCYQINLTMETASLTCKKASWLKEALLHIYNTHSFCKFPSFIWVQLLCVSFTVEYVLQSSPLRNILLYSGLK
ncbi:hypothetical protein XENORESO_016850 [Xenotaenia resolanae]|uniref:Uncharacterized protein n=1 Tax=Xenotaenia resolanae TaxID=208358 RepID=A0ABV0X304_9TELE